MTIQSTAEFIDILRKYKLLTGEQFTSTNASSFPTPQAIAKELVRRDWLSPYQVNQIFNGRAAGLLLGSYVLIERLGEGGMGAVYKARNNRLERIVALKLIRKEWLASKDAVKRFRREILAAAQLNHPNIVHTVDADEVDGSHFMVMDFAPGIDLAALVRQNGPLSVHQACEYIRQVALGLQHAYEQGMVHRDIKPHNLILARHSAGASEIVKILDMGLARMENVASDESATLTKEGIIIGTPDYIAPEQAMNSHTVDIRADIYSLGCTFYYLLTGKPPFPGGEMMDKLIRHQTEQPVAIEMFRTDVDERVTAIVYRMMAKKADERFQAPWEVAEALAQWQTTAPPESKRRSPAKRIAVANPFEHIDRADPAATKIDRQLRKPASNTRWLPVIGGMAAIVCAVILVVVVIRLTMISDAPPTNAKDEAKTKKKRVDQPPPKKKETPPKQFPPGPVTDEWVKHVQSLPPDDQAKTVFAKLAELNPGMELDGKHQSFTANGNSIVAIIHIRKMTDISPLAALHHVKNLTIPARYSGSGRFVVSLADLSPIKDLKPTRLDLHGHPIHDLTPLKNMPLGYLNLRDTSVEDISPLKNCPLENLNLRNTPVHDLSPLKNLNLIILDLANTYVDDLAPLAGMPLRELDLQGTPVNDLTPLRGSSLTRLNLTATCVADLTPLEGMPLIGLFADAGSVKSLAPLSKMPKLKELRCLVRSEEDVKLILSLKNLEKINDQTVEQFRKVTQPGPEHKKFLDSLSTMSPAEKVKIVGERLKQINGLEASPLFKPPEFEIKKGKVVALRLNAAGPGKADQIEDLTPLAGLPNLRSLTISGGVRNLWPLRNLPLEELILVHPQIIDLTPLAEMPLRKIDLGRSSNLLDLTPLAELPLQELTIGGMVADVRPLKDAPLIQLHLRASPVRNLDALSSEKLTSIILAFREERHADALRSFKGLKSLNGKPVAEFWKSHAEQQVEFVRRELKRLNPGFDGKIEFKHDRGIITEANVKGAGDGIYLAPIRHFPRLTKFGWYGGTKLTDLSPLKGFRLTHLFLGGQKELSDLSPLKDMPLQYLNVGSSKVTDLSALAGMPLNVLDFAGAPVEHLAPLIGMKIKDMRCAGTKVYDLTPLKEMPLERLYCSFSRWRDTEIVRSIKTLRKINGKPVDEFWKDVETEKAALDAWEFATRKLPAKEQIETVLAKLKELNPGFDGTHFKYGIANEAVTQIAYAGDKLEDVSPLRALPDLTTLNLQLKSGSKSKLANLWPLRGMKLEILAVPASQVADLRPLQGMPLKNLVISHCPVTDLLPLKGMKLNALNFAYTQVADLSPLKGIPLTYLQTRNFLGADLSPLKGMPLVRLELNPARHVTDISPLRGMPLQQLILRTSATDYTPLQESPLVSVGLPFVAWRDSRILRSIKTLETINGKPAKEAFAWADWEDRVRAMKPEGQVEAVRENLKELNPGFDDADGKAISGMIREGIVAEVTCRSNSIVDLSALRALPKLQSLNLAPGPDGKMKLADLLPLHGLPLRELHIAAAAVADLRPLHGMPLKTLSIGGCPVTDLSPLKGMPLESLTIAYTRVTDLSPLKGMPVRSLNALHAPIDNLAPLKGMRLTKLICRSAESKVSDLSPLKGMPLVFLEMGCSQATDLSPIAECPIKILRITKLVTDLSPLRKMPLETYLGSFVPERDAAILRQIKTLKTINGKPAADVLK